MASSSLRHPEATTASSSPGGVIHAGWGGSTTCPHCRKRLMLRRLSLEAHLRTHHAPLETSSSSSSSSSTTTLATGRADNVDAARRALSPRLGRGDACVDDAAVEKTRHLAQKQEKSRTDATANEGGVSSKLNPGGQFASPRVAAPSTTRKRPRRSCRSSTATTAAPSRAKRRRGEAIVIIDVDKDDEGQDAEKKGSSVDEGPPRSSVPRRGARPRPRSGQATPELLAPPTTTAASKVADDSGMSGVIPRGLRRRRPHRTSVGKAAAGPTQAAKEATTAAVVEKENREVNGKQEPTAQAVCPVCGVDLGTQDPVVINRHVDECLTRCMLQQEGQTSRYAAGLVPPARHVNVTASQPYLPPSWLQPVHRYACPYGCSVMLVEQHMPEHARTHHANDTQVRSCPICARLQGTDSPRRDLLEHLNSAHDPLLLRRKRKELEDRPASRDQDVEDPGDETLEFVTTRILSTPLPNEKVECSICFENLVLGQRVSYLPCLCIFHDVCIKHWCDKQKRMECPIHLQD